MLPAVVVVLVVVVVVVVGGVIVAVVSHPIYTNILGVARDLLWRFRGLDPEEDAWRRS